MSFGVQWILILSLLACADSAERSAEGEDRTAPSSATVAGEMELRITVNGAGNDKAKLLGVFGNQNYVADSAKADASGVFVFQADSLLPKGFYYLMLGSDNSYFQLLLDGDQEFEMTTEKGDLVGSMSINGSVSNELLYKNLQFEEEFSAKIAPVNKQLASLTEGMPEYARVKAKQDELVAERKAHLEWFEENHPNAFFTQFKMSGQNPELTYPKLPSGQLDQATQLYRYRKAFFDNVDFSTAWTIRTPVYANKLRKYIRELTPQNADSLIRYADELIARTMDNKELFKYTVNWIALEYKTPKTMGTETLYVHLIDTYWTPELAFWSNPEEIKGLRGEVALMKPSLIGKTAQDLQLKDANGEDVSLHGLGGNMNVLFIYSYDCEHCQKEAPEMVKVYNRWKGRGLRVLTLSTDKDREKWKQFIASKGMTGMVNTIDPDRSSRYERKYHIDITPEIYVLNKQNRIIASNLKPAQLEDFLHAEQERNPWY